MYYDEPAFPIPYDDRPGAYEAFPGMSLRDYFAAKVINGVAGGSPGSDPEWLARYAYRVADCMMAARLPRDPEAG